MRVQHSKVEIKERQARAGCCKAEKQEREMKMRQSKVETWYSQLSTKHNKVKIQDKQGQQDGGGQRKRRYMIDSEAEHHGDTAGEASKSRMVDRAEAQERQVKKRGS